MNKKPVVAIFVENMAVSSNVPVYQTTRCHIIEDTNIVLQRCKKLKL